MAYLRLVVSLTPKKVNADGGVTLLDFFAALAARDAARADGEEEIREGGGPRRSAYESPRSAARIDSSSVPMSAARRR